MSLPTIQELTDFLQEIYPKELGGNGRGWRHYERIYLYVRAGIEVDRIYHLPNLVTLTDDFERYELEPEPVMMHRWTTTDTTWPLQVTLPADRYPANFGRLREFHWIKIGDAFPQEQS